MWAESYRPRSIREMIGNEEGRLKLIGWFEKWKVGSKSALLVGPPGTGKTTLVHLLASEKGANLVELNASDTRTKDSLLKRMGEVTKSENLLGEKSLIFLDEIDGVSGRADYGAIEFIKETLKETQNPVVMAANNPESDQVRRLSSACIVIPFKPPPPREVEMYLKMIAQKEKIEVDGEVLRKIVTTAAGDVRFAINGLQGLGSMGRKDVEFTAAQAINSYLDAPNLDTALKALRAYPRQPRDKIRDLFSAVLTSKLPPEKKARAIESLSRADLLMGRIMRGQDWRLLRYLDSALAREFKAAIKGENLQYSQEGVPWNLILRIWNESKKVKELSAAYAPRAHNSRRGALVQDIPYVLVMCGSKKFRTELMKSMNLDEPFEKFLEKEAERTAKFE